MTYVVLGPVLQQTQPARFEALFAQFAAGYAKHFSGDEAESTNEWRARIEGKAPPQPVMRIVVAVEPASGGERVVGGLAVEYYRTSACVLATYLYVADEYRRHHYATDLLERARAACEALGVVRAMLAEAEWPEAMRKESSGGDVTAACERLGFFARIGGRLFQLDYIQPALGRDKQPVSHLRLFWLPAPNGGRPADDQLAASVSDFLGEFYDALAQETDGPSDEATLARMRKALSDRKGQPLTVPLPRLRLPQVALCLHFVETLDDTAADVDELLNAVRTYRCRVLHSMETDLLSNAYRTPADRLVRTVCLTKPPPSASADDEAGLDVEIELPSHIVFRSENRQEARRWPLRRRRARAYLAASFFLDARLIVWHLTLRADARQAGGDARGWLDEQDVIALSKLADEEADQESVRVRVEDSAEERRLATGITFRLTDGDRAARDVHGLLRAVAAITRERIQRSEGEDEAPPLPGRVSAPAATTVEILGWEVDRGKVSFGISSTGQRNALCGIISGILDFDRIDDAEARDTLTASVALDDALLRVHRERVVYVSRDDRAARTVAGSVGISPYLILPHAATLCDDRLLRRFEFPGTADRGSGKKLSMAVDRLEGALRRKWVPNPFFYATEQRLFEQALVEGGTVARRAREEERLLALKTCLDLTVQAQRARFEALAQALLGALAAISAAAISADTVAVQFIRWLRGAGAESAIVGDKTLGFLLAFWVALGFAVGVFRLVYAGKAPTTDDGRALDSDAVSPGTPLTGAAPAPGPPLTTRRRAGRARPARPARAARSSDRRP
jgi:GNAT superfamily N-acetyltransferase